LPSQLAEGLPNLSRPGAGPDQTARKSPSLKSTNRRFIIYSFRLPVSYGGNRTRAALRFNCRIGLAGLSMSDDQSTHRVLDPTEEQSHMLVESVEDYAIYMLDPTGNIMTWNSGAQKMKQYTADEIIGKNFACFYTAEDVAAEKPQRNLRRATRKGHIRDQGLRVRKDGSRFHAEVVITALRDSDGNVRGFSKVTRDATDQICSRETEAAKIAAEKARKAKKNVRESRRH